MYVTTWFNLTVITMVAVINFQAEVSLVKNRATTLSPLYVHVLTFAQARAIKYVVTDHFIAILDLICVWLQCILLA